MVARIVRQVGRLGIKIGKVRNLGGVDRLQEAKVVQHLCEGRRHEGHIEPLATRGDDLAHDLFVGGVDDHFGRLAGFLGEILDRIGGHVAIPVGDHEVGKRRRGRHGKRGAGKQRVQRKRGLGHGCSSLAGLVWSFFCISACPFDIRQGLS